MIDVRAAKQWLTAAEAAAEALPGLPTTKQGMNIALRTANIATRKRAGARGAFREFHWTSLPPEARAEYLQRHGAACADAEPDAQTRAVSRQIRCNARLAILDAAKALIADESLAIGKGLEVFCRLYARRKAEVDPWVYEIEPHLKPHAIRAWDRTVREHGTGALIDTRGRPQGTRIIAKDDALNAYILAQISARPHLSCPQLRLAIAADCGHDIPLRTLQAFVAEFRAGNKGVLKALTDPDKHRSHHKPAFGSRADTAPHINALWEIDATRADAMCRTQSGLRRCTLTLIVDVFTRRAKVLVSDQPHAAATMALLRRAIIAWGLPARLKLDNGKEFAARAVKRFCTDLKITLSYSRPFHPEEKPHVERAFGTLNKGFLPLLPGYVGANVAQRQAIEHRKSFAHRFGDEARLTFETELTPEGLQARLDAYIRDIYERTEHDGLKGELKTPFAMALAHGADARRISNERALDALLLPAPKGKGIRAVGKKGVQVGTRFYVAPELGARAARADKVLVKLDPHEPGRAVIYSADGQNFICVAEDAETIGSARLIKIASEAKSEARRAIAGVRRAAGNVLKLFPGDELADRILAAAGGNIDLTPDARDAMIAADTPNVMAEHARALAALEHAKEPPQPIVPTREQEEGAAEYFAQLQARADKPPLQIVQRGGYERPWFDDDADFCDWADAHLASGCVLDAGDAVLFAELNADHTLQRLRRNKAQG